MKQEINKNKHLTSEERELIAIFQAKGFSLRNRNWVTSSKTS